MYHTADPTQMPSPRSEHSTLFIFMTVEWDDHDCYAGHTDASDSAHAKSNREKSALRRYQEINRK